MKSSFSHSYQSTQTMVYFGTREDLTIGGKYEVTPYQPTYSGSEDYVVILHNDLDFLITIDMKEFCTIEEWREKQINRII